ALTDRWRRTQMTTRKKTAARKAPAKARKAAPAAAKTRAKATPAKKAAAKKSPARKATLRKPAPRKAPAGPAQKAAARRTTSPPAPPRQAPERMPAPVAGPDQELAFMIESAWARRSMLTPEEIEGSTRLLVDQAIEGLESGRLRVAEPDGAGGWVVNEWLKKAVLLYFRVQEMEAGEQYPAPYWDKIPMRFADFDEAAFRKLGARVLPGAIARRGSYIGRDVVLMPSFVNIGAHIGAGTMVDTWATVGSCAQVGKHCHISGGAGIGGVLEPL